MNVQWQVNLLVVRGRPLASHRRVHPNECLNYFQNSGYEPE